MAESKLDLPDDLLSSKASDHSWTPKVEASRRANLDKVLVGSHDESKDQVTSESSIPLSPQWLYNKPSESKDARAPTSVSLGNSNDPNQKEGWRLDSSEDKKDWRRIATESESSRRWREEERETGLLVARRDRRKTDRRVDSVPIRETMDGRTLPSSDRWNDGGSRNSGHEARRDSKWSSRWGPDDKEKESRAEKRTDGEKDDAHTDNQSSIGSKTLASERDSDSRDKWRPRHRMEAHSAGSSNRAAPGFGLERGRIEVSNLGFSAGRGRSSAIGRSSPSGTIHLYKSGNFIGKPNFTTDSFCYPRGKLLDIYRSQKLDPSFATMSYEMEESLPITQVSRIEPLAFVAPDAEEEAILTDIWNGKITSSGVVYNSFRKGRSTENFSGFGDVEAADGKQGILPSLLAEETADTFEEVANDDAFQTDGCFSSDRGSLNELHEKDVGKGKENKVNADGFNGKVVKSDDDICSTEVSDTISYAASQLDVGKDWKMANSAITQHFSSIDSEPTISIDVKSKLPDDSSSLFVLSSPEQNQHNCAPHMESNREEKALENDLPLEDLYFCYIDPHGNTQGPFVGADIVMWFDQGYFGTDLPVRLAEAPKDTPFKSLGEVMPHLKLRRGYSTSEQEQSGGLGGKVDSSLPVASVPEFTEPSTVNDSYQPLLESNIHSAQHAHPRMSEAEVSFQLPHSEAQIFNESTAQEEEIVFPGRSLSGGYPAVKSSGNIHDPKANSSSYPSLPKELTETGLPYQNDSKMHPFGLLWSELEGSHARHSESSNVPSSAGRAAAFGSIIGPASVADKRSDLCRQDTVSGPNSFQDTIAAHHLSHIEQEPNHFDLAEQFLSRQFQQQQFTQRNLMSPQAQLHESLLEHMPTQNLIHHQQLANHPAPDLEHLLALQLQQQQQRQLQLQQHQLQQQQFHQQQKILQERQQSQVRNALLEQFLHGQMPDPNLPQSHVDPIRANKVVDQLLLEQQLMHELQQRAHQPLRHFVPSIEQLTQAKYAQAPLQEQQRDLFELLLHAQHGQVQSLEDRILRQEQLQARQLSMGLRQRANMEDEMHVNDSDQFRRSLGGGHRAHTSGINALDFYQQQQRPPVEEQLSQLERNLSFQDRIRQGLYESGSMPFEQSLSLPAGASGMNMDVLNAMARAQGLNMQELNVRMQSAGQAGAFSSGIHPHNPHNSMVPNQFNVSHLDTMEGHWPESNGQISNDWMESGIQQLRINAERQKRGSEVSMTAHDPSLWMSDGMNDEKSRRLLIDLLHQKSGNQPAESINMNDGMPFERRVLSGLYSGLSSSDHPFSVVPDQESGVNNSFAVGSYGSSEALEACSTNDQASNLESMSRVSETGQAIIADSNVIEKSSIVKEYLEVEGRKFGSKSQGIMKGSVSEIPDDTRGQVRLVAAGCGETPFIAVSGHSSLGVSGGNAGFYEDKTVTQSSINQVPVTSKGQENILLRRPPVSHALSSQEGISELVSDTVTRGKSSMNSADGGNSGNQTADISSGKKEVCFRRTSSCSDADVSEPSFIDMLKSNVKKTTTPDIPSAAALESSDGAQGGRGGKKKGKKGRQIDPSLLGFRVTSNRIMMGEIQRPED